MRHLTTLTMLFLCIVVFTNCTKKATETFTPTESYHPPQKTIEVIEEEPVVMVSKNPPSVEEGTFWIGSSMNHTFSMDAGVIDMKGVYALNNRDELNVDSYGNLKFYPTKSLADIEFFKSEIGNLDYEEGYLYQVEGTKHYLGTKLWGVVVNRVIQKIEDSKEVTVETKTVTNANGSTTTTTTTTTKVKQSSSSSSSSSSSNSNSSTTVKKSDPVSMVSKDTPSNVQGTFWISSRKDHAFSMKAGSINVKGAYAINNNPILNKNSAGNLMFYPTESMTMMEFFSSEIHNLDYKEGYYYKVEGVKYYLGKTLSGIRVNKVLQKVKDNSFSKAGSTTIVEVDPTPTWHPSEEVDETPDEDFGTVFPDSNDEGIFWIGSTKNHSVAMEVGTINVNGAYAINTKDNLAKDRSGNLIFYPTKSLDEFKFFPDRIKNFKFVPGSFYKVEGTLDYSGDKLMTVSVNKILQIVKDKNFTPSSDQDTKPFTPTVATHPTKPIKNNPNNGGSKVSTKTTKVSSAPASKSEGTFWIGPSKNVDLTTDKGGLKANNCYVINNNAQLNEDPFAGLIFYPHSDLKHMNILCKKIEGFEYEEGFLYQIKGTRHYNGKKLTGIEIDKVLRKVEDKNFVKKEELIVFIGPETKKGTGMHGNELDCYQIQYGTFSRSAEWGYHCGWIGGFEYEPGFLYKLKINRVHRSKKELKMTADLEAYQDQLVTIMKIQKM